ncbi:methyltransferase domain-containing protein [Amycolatopsis roodepoortensis]|uniref:class I SAM-dependent methyltransferase n=1 Tax=Amycolatopsis roodepoortensis TaxID=700274 RepID=UPI00214B3075|nr:methyltransferase domain-containing protein [Amycolatopsis roodepoortensis]UUV28668.1 methyltransferase domain-containing protein [Amycolatopsis roodepoortensis]
MSDEHGNERLRDVWDRYASRYDRDMGFVERLQFGGGREWVCSQAGGDVLEVAIGTGRNLPHYPAGVTLTGLDLSPAMLDIARIRAVELGRDVELCEGDAQELPFPDASFDTVVCTLGLCGVPDDRAAIGEMYRVLRPGGTLLLLDHIGSHRKIVHFGQSLLEKVSLRMCGDYQTRRPLPLVEQAGFVVRRQERLKLGTVERVAAVKA